MAVMLLCCKNLKQKILVNFKNKSVSQHLIARLDIIDQWIKFRSFFHFSGSLFPDLLSASTRDLGRRPLASSSLWNGFLLSESLAPILLWSSKSWEPVCRLGKLQRQLIGHFQVAFLRSANMFIFIQIDSFSYETCTETHFEVVANWLRAKKNPVNQSIIQSSIQSTTSQKSQTYCYLQCF